MKVLSGFIPSLFNFDCGSHSRGVGSNQISLRSFGVLLIAILAIGSWSPSYAQDTDGDTILDIDDVDDDGDGILDTLECSGASAVFTRINAGGNGFTDAQGRIWQTDSSFTGGTVVGVSNTINVNLNSGPDIGDTSDAVLYNNIRAFTANGGTGSFSYNFPVPAIDTYTVVLHFGEGFNDGNVRDYAVLIEGTAVLNNFNIEAAFGARTAGTRTFSRAVSDGTLNIEFTGAGFPQVSGIEFVSSTALIIDPDIDGFDNCLDIDSDNDGIPDNVEAQPTGAYIGPPVATSYIPPSGTVDTTPGSPTIGLDIAYIGYSPTVGGATSNGLVPQDTDGLGSPDYLDTDADEDGLQDFRENGFVVTFTTPSGNEVLIVFDDNDDDGDGLINQFDTVPGFDVNDSFDDPGNNGGTGIGNLPDTDEPMPDGDCCTAPRTNDVDYRDISVPQSVTKVGTAVSPVSTTEVNADGLIDWVVSYSNDSGGTLRNVFIDDTISGDHTIVPGSEQLPPGWNLVGGDFTAPVVTDTPSSGGSIDLTQLVSGVSVGSGGGDGLVPIIAPDRRIYFSFHHRRAVLQCVNPFGGNICDNFNATLGNILPPFNDTAGDGITNSEGYMSDNAHTIQFVGNRLYYPVTRFPLGQLANNALDDPIDWGLGCVEVNELADPAMPPAINPAPIPCADMVTEGIAGYLALGPSGYNPTNALNSGIQGPFLHNDRLYLFDNGATIHCFDPATAAVCTGFPIDFSSTTTFPRIVADSGVINPAALTGKQDGNRLFVIISYVGKVTNGTDVEDYRVRCFDMDTAAECAGWSGAQQLSPQGRVAGDTGLSGIGSAYESFFRRTTANVIDALCLYSHQGGVGCVNSNSGAPIPNGVGDFFGVPDSLHNVLRLDNSSDIAVIPTTDFKGMLHEITVGSRMYFGTFFRDGIFCWDWSTDDWCAVNASLDPNGDGIWGDTPAATVFGSNGETGVAFLNSNQGGETRDYGATFDPVTGCFWALGDTNRLWNYDGLGNNPCGLNGASGSSVVIPSDFFCGSGLIAANFDWNTLFLKEINLDEWARATVEFFDDAGFISDNPLVACDFLLVPDNGPFPHTDAAGCVFIARDVIDMNAMNEPPSAIAGVFDAGGNPITPLTFRYNGSVPAGTNINTLERDPAVIMTFQSLNTSVELCFQTRVGNENQCAFVNGTPGIASNMAEVQIQGNTSFDGSVGPISLDINRGSNLLGCSDLGDAPNTYGTNIAAAGDAALVAGHGIRDGSAVVPPGPVGALLIGAATDQEDDAIGNAGANSDSDDGVSFQSFSQGPPFRIDATMPITNTTGEAALLCGYMDGYTDGVVNDTFDRNAVYTGFDATAPTAPTTTAGNEEICVQVSQAGGPATSLIYPDGSSGSCTATTAGGLATCTISFLTQFTSSTTTYSRFRLSSDPSFFSITTPSPIGGLRDGEVEDYVNFLNPTAVTIGTIDLDPTTIAAFFAQLDVANLSNQQLHDLLRVWDADAASNLSVTDREGILNAIRAFLDPDNDGQFAMIAWDTLEERGTIGFFIERNTDPEGGGTWQRINDQMLPGLINAPLGGEYRLIDPAVVAGETYTYRLIEQEADGNRRHYGPFELRM